MGAPGTEALRHNVALDAHANPHRRGLAHRRSTPQSCEVVVHLQVRGEEMSLTTEEPVLAHDVAVRLGNEIPLHALGESVAASALAAQRGIARQQCDGPVYVLDELELALPVRVRIDPFGQVIVSVPYPPPHTPLATAPL